MAELTPYDTGARLEPHVWVRGDTVSPNGATRPAGAEEYGRVDFDADDGTTILSLFVEAADTGYCVQVAQLGEDYVDVVGANRPPALSGPSWNLDAPYRERQMMLLDAGLQEIGREFSEHVLFSYGDPLAFCPGHVVLTPREAGQAWFAIEEVYPHAGDWEDPERVPVGWQWREAGPVVMPDGRVDVQQVAQGTTIPSDIGHLLQRARTWAQAASRDAEEAQALSPGRTAHRPDPHRDGRAR